MATTNPINNATSALTVNSAYSLPTADGNNGDVLTTNGSGTVTWEAAATGVTYEEVTDSTKAMAVNYSYGVNRGAGITLTLPAAASVGDVIQIIGIDGIWIIAQNAGQTISVGLSDSTTGAGGSLTATDAGDCITLRCIVTDTDFRVTSMMGNITIA